MSHLVGYPFLLFIWDTSGYGLTNDNFPIDGEEIFCGAALDHRPNAKLARSLTRLPKKCFASSAIRCFQQAIVDCSLSYIESFKTLLV